MSKAWLFLGMAAILLVGLFVFSWRSSLAKEEPYVKMIAEKKVLKDTAQLIWHYENSTGFRFYPYTFEEYHRKYDDVDIKTAKILYPGDSLHLVDARSYYSVFSGKSIFLIGEDSVDGHLVRYEWKVWPN